MQRIVGNTLIALNALLLVFLIFDQRMVYPAWIQSVGRIHPLLLHIPIGAIVFSSLFLLLKKGTKWLLAVGAITAVLTSIMGIILSKEGGYAEDTLMFHKYSGAILSFVLTAAFFTSHKGIPIIASLVLVLIAGHFGSVLTHGDQFVFEPLLSKKTKSTMTVTDSTSLYAATIEPIFHQKCESCHNEKKAKGELVLSTLAGVAKGGEHGVPWHGGHPQSSILIKRVLLPEDHEDHMPPKGKSQLSATEVQLLFQWILSGADTAKAWTKYHPSDSVRKLAEQFINRTNSATKHYTFEAASPETIEKLNDPYRVVTPIAQDEPALAATFFIRSEFKPSRLEELSSVRDQLVSLNLSKMPVTDADCGTIAKFKHLEKLNLNFSSITDKGLKILSSLENLKSLSLAGVTLDENAASVLKEFKSLRETYFLNEAAYANEKLRLTPPIPASDKTLYDVGEKISLTHKLPGIVIRYTTDGSDPDSTSATTYHEPFAINGYTILKTRACKDGWYCSPVGTFVLYNKGVMPLETKLTTTPNKDYKGEGAATLTNNKKGFTDDNRDIAWIGFRENPLAAEFRFDAGTKIHNITMSYDHSPGGWLFPPSKLEIWGGKDPQHLQLVKELKPEQPSKMESTRNAALVIPVEGEYEVYKIIAWPVPELPKWHPSNEPKTKDKRAWLFVDEIIFSQ